MHVTATAPVRTADVGGWTDTWFAVRGAVCNVAIEPGVEVRVEPLDTADPDVIAEVQAGHVTHRVEARAPDGGDADLLLAALCRSAASDRPARVTIRSGVPAGSGTGSSAAVSVAVLAALDAWAGRDVDADALASTAHAIETGLGWQSGVQDQLASAHGGIHLFEIEYPRCTASQLLGRAIGDEISAAFDERLLTVYLGHPHASSAVHETVIASFDSTESTLLDPLRVAARAAFDALRAEDLRAYGRVLVDAHEGVRALHAGLVSPTADRVAAVAAAHGAWGWKVNGAGGSGGSIAVLGPEDPRALSALRRAIEAIVGCSLLRTRVARRGVRIL